MPKTAMPGRDHNADLPRAEIGLILDLSESRVSQNHRAMPDRLRKRFQNETEKG